MTAQGALQKMDNNQSNFINTIQSALGRSSASAPAKISGTPPEDLDKQLAAYTNKSKVDRMGLLELFVEQAKLLQIEVIQAGNSAEAGRSIRKLVLNSQPEWGDKKSIVAWHHPLIEQLGLQEALGKDGVDVFITKMPDKPTAEEREEVRTQIIASYIGITAADFCIAPSATLVMRTRPGQPRAVSLVPSIHVAVIKANQIIESLKELYFRLKWDQNEKKQGLTNCLTFISGPSKTADIELQMVFGAHGPKQLYVCVIEEGVITS